MQIYDLLKAPCIFCGYDGENYYQNGTHAIACPWYDIGGGKERVIYFIKAARDGLLNIDVVNPQTESDYMRLYAKGLREIIKTNRIQKYLETGNDE